MSETLRDIRERQFSERTLDDAQTDIGLLLKRLGAHEGPDEELGYTPPMVVTAGDCEILAHCGDCEAPLGSIQPDGSLDTLFTNWERHAMREHTHG